MKKFDNKFSWHPFGALPTRPTYHWPNPAKLAVYFALNINQPKLRLSQHTLDKLEKCNILKSQPTDKLINQSIN